MQKRIQTKNVEDTAGEVHHTLELQNLEQSLQQLHIQLAERTSQLDSYEKVNSFEFFFYIIHFFDLINIKIKIFYLNIQFSFHTIIHNYKRIYI